MKFTPDFIEKVQEANNLLDIISQHTQLRPTGSGFMGRCPFPDHPEKTPSFSVSEIKQVYHCFGCQKKGNIFTFVQDFNGMSFPEAVEFLAQRASIPLPEDGDGRGGEDKRKKKEIKDLNQLVAQYFRKQLQSLPPDHPAILYINKRNIYPESQQLFGMGYARPEWDHLVEFLQAKGVSLVLAEEAKLIKRKKAGSGTAEKAEYFDLFRDRIMFPILNIQNEVVAFGGRIVNTGEPKYLNSPETSVFQKGKIFYGLNWSAKHIRTEDQVLVVEGYLDLISLFQAGLKPVVATMGTALTTDHGKILKRLTNNVMALFDGDSAGQEAAQRSLPILLQSETWPKGLILPDNMDPDDFMKTHGLEAFKAFIVSNSQDLFSLILQKKLHGYKAEPAQNMNLLNELKPIFASMRDSRLRELYLQEISQKTNMDKVFLTKNLLGVTADALAQNVQAQSVRTLMPLASVVPVESMYSLKGVSRTELFVLSLVLKSRAHFKKYLNAKMKPYFLSETVRNILSQAEDSSRQSLDKFDKFLSLLTLKVDHPKLLFVAWSNISDGTDQSSQVVHSENAPLNLAGDFSADFSADFLTVAEESEDKVLRDSFKKLKREYFQKKADELTLAIKIHSTPEKLTEYMNLQKERVQLDKEEI